MTLGETQHPRAWVGTSARSTSSTAYFGTYPYMSREGEPAASTLNSKKKRTRKKIKSGVSNRQPWRGAYLPELVGT